MNKYLFWFSAFVVLMTAQTTQAQQGSLVPYPIRGAVHSNSTSGVAVVHVGHVTQVGAPWMRVHIGAHDLGANSYVVFTSLEDGEYLRHNATTLKQWNGWSAYFNGDAVDIELHVGGGDEGVYVDVDHVLMGLYEADTRRAIEANPTQRGVCDGDSRVSSSALRIGRFIDIDPNDPSNSGAGCTGWIIANGAILTAGHCGPVFPLIEFDIVPSDCDGTVNFGSANAQYAVDPDSITNSNTGTGDDWSILTVFPNPNTGLLPAYGQGAFARLARDLDTLDPATVRNTGCGVDKTPVGCTGLRNSDSQTRQTSTGTYRGESATYFGTIIEYDDVDATGSSSGSPVFDVAFNVAIGIHTGSYTCSNWGTSFNHNPLEFAINSFPGSGTVYVDRGHPITAETGQIFRPWLTLDAGLADVPAGGILSVVTGDYTLANGVINQPVTITAPVGPVIID